MGGIGGAALQASPLRDLNLQAALRFTVLMVLSRARIPDKKSDSPHQHLYVPTVELQPPHPQYEEEESLRSRAVTASIIG